MLSRTLAKIDADCAELLPSGRFQRIIAAVALVTEIPVEAIVSRSHEPENVAARALAIYTARDGGRVTLDALTYRFRRGSTPLMNAIAAVESRRASEPDFGQAMAHVGLHIKRFERHPALMLDLLRSQALIGPQTAMVPEFCDRRAGEFPDMTESPRPAVSAAVTLQDEEMRRLRKVGWSVTALAKRYDMPEAHVAARLGVEWRVAR